jgi:hypothetical protein
MPETFQFTCPECGNQIQLRAALAGREGACPGCKKVVTIQPDPPAAAPTEPAEAAEPAVESAPAPPTPAAAEPAVEPPVVVLDLASLAAPAAPPTPAAAEPAVEPPAPVLDLASLVAPAAPPTPAAAEPIAPAPPALAPPLAPPAPAPLSPPVAEPQLVQPGVVQPGIVQPGIVQPGIVQPGIVQPGIVQPGIVQPGIVQPGIVQPDVAPPAGGKKKRLIYIAAGAGGLVVLALVLFLFMGGGGGQSSPEALGRAVFQAFKANDKDAVSGLAFYNEARMGIIRDKILAKADGEAEKKRRANRMSDEAMNEEIDEWQEEMSDDFNELQKSVDWGQAELVAVLDNEGQRDPESDVADWGGRDNVRLFVIYEVNGRLFALTWSEIIKFDGGWFLLGKNIRVQSLSEMGANEYSRGTLEYALKKHGGSSSDRIRDALN